MGCAKDGINYASSIVNTYVLFYRAVIPQKLIGHECSFRNIHGLYISSKNIFTILELMVYCINICHITIHSIKHNILVPYKTDWMIS